MELCRLPTWFVLLAVLGLSAGAAAFDSPEAAVEMVMRYFAVHDFQGYISVMDPEVVREFNEFIMFVLSQMPEDEAHDFAALLVPGGTPESLREEDPARLMEAFFASFHEFLPLYVSGTVIGTVYESEDVAHVLVRVTGFTAGSDLPGLTQVEVVTARRTPNGWRIRLKGDISVTELLSRFMAAFGEVE